LSVNGRVRRLQKWLEVSPSRTLRVERRLRPRTGEAVEAASLVDALRPWCRAAQRWRFLTAVQRAAIVAFAALVPLLALERGGVVSRGVAIGLAIVSAAAVIVAVAVRDVPPIAVARLLDRDLGLDEQIATALSVSESGRPARTALDDLLLHRAAGLVRASRDIRIGRVASRRDGALLIGLAALALAVALLPAPSYRGGGARAPDVAATARMLPAPVVATPISRPSAPLRLRAAIVGARSPRVLHQQQAAGVTRQATPSRRTPDGARTHSKVASGRRASSMSQTATGGGAKAGSFAGKPQRVSAGEAGRRPRVPARSTVASGGRRVRTIPTKPSTSRVRGAPDNPYAIPGSPRQTSQTRPGLAVNGEVAGSGFGAGNTPGTVHSAAGRHAAGRVANSATKRLTLVDLRPPRRAQGVAAGPQTTARGSRGAMSGAGFDATPYVAPDANRVQFALRNLFDSYFALPAKGT
jgi:hypothetical protein